MPPPPLCRAFDISRYAAFSFRGFATCIFAASFSLRDCRSFESFSRLVLMLRSATLLFRYARLPRRLDAPLFITPGHLSFGNAEIPCRY